MISLVRTISRITSLIGGTLLIALTMLTCLSLAGRMLNSFLHLDQVDVKAGMMIKRGDLIGTIGATGRATGPHLDWRIDWQGRRIDPGLLVSPMPNPAS